MKTINKNTCHYPAGLDNPEKGNSHFTRYSGQARVGQNKKAFTLVELIIVISILAILATIAFVSFQNFTKDARDGNRVSTIKTIESGLELYTIKTGNYPTPEGEISTGTINDQSLTYKGVIGETIGKQINMNKTPLDPLTKKNYVYGITANKREYQIASVLEGDMAYKTPPNLPLSREELSYFPMIRGIEGVMIPQVNAASSTYYSKVSGNYKGFIIYSSGSGINTETWIANIPSLIYNFTGTTNLLSTTGAYFIINKGKNLPYAPNPQTQINHKTLAETIQEKTNKSEAKLINMKKSELETIAKTGTGTLPDGVTSTGELFSSFGVETKESLEVLITGTSTQTHTPQTLEEDEETPLSCGVDLYEVSGGCVTVGIGYYSPDGVNTRTACNNQPASNSEYTGMGNGSDNCPFSCTGGYSGPTCDIQPLGTIGTVTYTGGTVYTYTTKVMPMLTSTGYTYNATWTTQNMRHPVSVGGNNCFITTSWPSTDTGKCSVGHQTNSVVGYDDTTTQTNLYGMYYQWSAAKEVCKLLGEGWDLASNEKFMDLERGLGCTDPTPTGTRNRCGNGYGGFSSGTQGLGYTASSTESVRYMGGVFGNSSTSLPGNRHPGGTFLDRGSLGYWWSATGGGSSASGRGLGSSRSTVFLYADNVAYGFSVVCFKN